MGTYAPHLAILLACTALATPGARAQCTPIQSPRILASDAAAGDEFGYSVAISGDTMVVGAPDHDLPGTGNAGVAYVYVRAGTDWVQQQILTIADAAAGDNFGGSVAISGDTIAVGSPFNTHDGNQAAGSCYVFSRSGTAWTQQQTLTAADAGANAYFGLSIAISDDTITIGAPYESHDGLTNAGSCYVFARAGTTWTQRQILTASDAATDDRFGSSVAISGDTIAIGAEDQTRGGLLAAGSCYVFIRSGTTWTQQQELTASDAAASDHFGASVTISGDTVVVGSPYEDHAGKTAAGACSVFVRSGTTWAQQQILTAAGGAAQDRFGSSVSISGDTVCVGSPFSTHDGNQSGGSCSIFVRSGTTWTQQQTLTASDAAAFDVFGSSVAMSGGILAVGAPGETNAAGASAGSVYAFDFLPLITVQPQPALACPSGSAQFSAAAIGPATLTYSWQVQTAPGIWQTLGNDPGPFPCPGGGTAMALATPVNSSTAAIGIRLCPGSHGAPQHFQVRCLIANDCGSTATSEATYTICPADINCSGDVTFQDVLDFLVDWFAASPVADINGSGAVTVQDIFDFLSAWFGRC